MNLKVQKRLASQILNCSPDRVIFNDDRLEDIKQAITKRDLKLLIGDGAITRRPGNFTSKVRSRKLALQKRKGRRSGPGTRKGKFTARFKPKKTWMSRLRVQREFLKMLLEKKILTKEAYRELYLKSKGGYFRSKRHIKLYLQEHDELLFDKEAIKKVPVESEKSRKIIKQ
ncbi:MAG: 50S ribosomal protein L19e [Candidatus Woesearchaeota archaeon]